MVFKAWQFPIPYKLCTRDLISCIKSCPAVKEGYSGQKKFMTSPTENDYECDEDDYQAIQEIQELQSGSALLGDSYPKYGKMGHRKMVLGKKVKLLHKQLWSLQRREIVDDDSDIDEIEASQDFMAFTTFLDPVTDHDPICSSQCQITYACGTETAPEFNGIY
jgi:hypothetical protein